MGSSAVMSLRTGLERLGEPAGKFESEFVAALGQPRSVKTLTSGRRLVEWRRGGRLRAQMIAVLFDLDRRFVEVVARQPSSRTSRQASTSRTGAETMSVRQTLALIDLRDAGQASVGRASRQGVWARSRP